MPFTIQECAIKGLYEIQPKVLETSRDIFLRPTAKRTLWRPVLP